MWMAACQVVMLAFSGMAGGSASRLAPAMAMATAGLVRPAESAEPAEPAVVRFPHEADLWDAALSADGRLHVVYSVKATDPERRGASDLFYVATRDASHQQWLDARRVPTGNLPATVGGERKALVAVMPHDIVLVSWPSSGRIGAARSADNGGSWVAVSPREPNAPGHADTMTMGASRGGRVAFAWTDTAAMGRGGDELAAPLHVAVSTNSGATYEPAVAINTELPGACVCCTPDVAFDDAGQLFVAYRTSTENVKEICLARVDMNGQVDGTIVSHDDWHLKGCPMNGPEIAVSGDGAKVNATWTRDGLIRGALSEDGGRVFGEVRDLGAGKYHSGAAAGASVWMMWERQGQVALGSADSTEDVETVAVNPQAVLLVTEDGRALVVVSAGESRTGVAPHH